MDFPTSFKIQIVRLVTKLIEYETSFTVGTVIDVLYRSGYWPENVNRINAYFRVQQIIEDTLINLDYDSYTEDMVTIYIPKKVLKEMEEEEKARNLTIDDIINMTVKNVPVDNNYEFKLPKFNQFWNKGWEKFF